MASRPVATRSLPNEPVERAPTQATSDTRAEVSPIADSVEGAKALKIATDATTILENLKESERLHVDSIIESSGLNAQTVLRLLLELELEGRVTQHPGKLFSLA